MQKFSDEVLFRDECFRIVGLCMKIHNILGKGFKEVVYKDALELELKNNGISYEREKSFTIIYDSIILKYGFYADFVVYNYIILEIKAGYQLHLENFKQTLNYLKASQIRLGILINFGENKLRFQRVVCTD